MYPIAGLGETCTYGELCGRKIHKTNIPYSWKIWRELNLIVTSNVHVFVREADVLRTRAL